LNFKNEIGISIENTAPEVPSELPGTLLLEPQTSYKPYFQMKKIYLLLICSLLASSCKDFLEEDTKSVSTNATFYNSINGLNNLVVSCYVSNKMWYAKEEGYDFSDIGTDTYTYGQQHPNQNEFTFAPSFNSFNGRLTVLWVEFYKGVNACNEALLFLDNPNHPMSDAEKKKRKGEVLFLRSHYFWLLTETWGSVPMPLARTENPVNFTVERTPIKDIYNQILTDLNASYDLLTETDNATDAEFGRVTRDAVRAFRARINLTVASYIKHAGNVNGLSGNADEYYTNALADASTLITSGKYSFYSTYADLWKFDNNTTSRNKEGIWAINYSRGNSSMLNINLTEYTDYFAPGTKPYDEREGGHHGHLMWLTRYDFGNFSGMVRDLANGRPFRRYAPNKYLIDAFNEDIDARYNGQFRSTWIANAANPSSPTVTTYPRWNQFNLPVGFTPPGSISDPVFKKGDTAIVITKKKLPEEKIAPNKDPNSLAKFLYVHDGKAYLVWDYNRLYNPDGTFAAATNGHDFFIPLKKFEDPNRAAPNGAGSANGARDAYVFRLAEMYLIAAEAATELGQDGYSYLLTLANSRALPGHTGTELLASYGINSSADVTIDKILDERAREFPGEQLRWFDLKRLHTPEAFVARIKQFNPDTKIDLDVHHYVRPIPQVQLDAIENASEFGQNPGY
jgi:starch-binding outer membrane protein, SusD/RagB family